MKNSQKYNFYFYLIFFSFILLIILNNINQILSKEINLSVIHPKHLEKLYTKCKEDNIFFCSMVEAIKYSLTLIKEDSKSFPIDICTDDFCLKYKNVYTPNIMCEDVETEIKNISIKTSNSTLFLDEQKYIIYFSNCSVIVEGDLSLNDEKKLKFLSEIYFDHINFYQSPHPTKGELNISFEYDTTFVEAFNYNKSEEIFMNDETNLIYQMDNILKEVLEHFMQNYKSILEVDEIIQQNEIYFKEIINKFGKEYSLLFSKIDDNRNDITYIGYNIIRYNSYINVRNKLFIPNLYIIFEYALNYNITYNEGQFIFENVTISRNNDDDFFGNMTNKTAEFNDLICEEDKNLIWNNINKDFYNNFKNYKI